MFKKGNKTSGLFFSEGLNPYDFPDCLFKSLSSFKEPLFLESFNNYIETVKVVSVKSQINEEDKKILTKVKDNVTWKELGYLYAENEYILSELLFSQSFKELPDVSELIVDEEDSDLSFLNHFLIIDLDQNKLSHYMGGLGFNFCRTLCQEISFVDISDNNDLNSENFLQNYSKLLQKNMELPNR